MTGTGEDGQDGGGRAGRATRWVWAGRAVPTGGPPADQKPIGGPPVATGRTVCFSVSPGSTGLDSRRSRPYTSTWKSCDSLPGALRSSPVPSPALACPLLCEEQAGKMLGYEQMIARHVERLAALPAQPIPGGVPCGLQDRQGRTPLNAGSSAVSRMARTPRRNPNETPPVSGPLRRPSVRPEGTEPLSRPAAPTRNGRHPLMQVLGVRCPCPPEPSESVCTWLTHIP
jgi:hypothetical protein